MPVLKHCCCCATLAVGGVIIGWINLIFALLEIIGTAISISKMESIKEIFLEILPDHRDISDLIISVGTIVLSIVLVIKIVGFIVAILLIIGATKSNRFHILPHLIFEAVYIFIIFVVWITFLVAVFVETDFIAVFVFFTLAFAFNLYLWLCVLSLYQEIRDNESRPPADSYLMRPTGPNLEIQHKPPSYATQQNLL